MDRNLISVNYLCICNISIHHHKQVGTPFVILSQSGVSIYIQIETEVMGY